MTGENGPPMDGWVCEPRPCPLECHACELPLTDAAGITRGEN